MDDHIAKPVDSRLLLGVLAAHLRGRARAPGSGEVLGAAIGEPGVVDLDRALDRLDGNRPLLDRMVTQFRDEVAGARRHLHQCLEGRARDALGFAVHRLRGQALGLDAGRLAATLGTLESLVADERWEASASALEAVDRAIDQLLDALPRG